MHKHHLLKIGELANLSSVPIKTIRYYSDIGLLPPSSTSEAGFRYYSGSDAARLTLIRSLRESGLSLERIRALLQNDTDVSTALTLQLHQIDSKISHLQDQKVLLQTVLEHDEQELLERLNNAHTLNHLDGEGRKLFLSKQLLKALPADEADGGWKSRLWLWQEGILRLPKKISGDRIKAWLELAELVLDDTFQSRLHELGETTWKRQRESKDATEWRAQQDELLLKALELAQRGQAPQGDAGQTLIKEFVRVNASSMGRDHDVTFASYLVGFIDGIADPLFDRYWVLVGTLRGQTPVTMWCKYQARSWLIDGLRWQISQAVRDTPA